MDSSGLLTVNGNIAEGTYDFVIKVANDAGIDTKDAKLEVAPAPTIGPIKPPIRPLTTPLYWNGSGGGAVLLAAPASPSTSGQAPPTTVQSATEAYPADKIRCMTFTLTDVSLSRPALVGTAYSGSAMLNTAYADPIPVKIVGARMDTGGSLPEMRTGIVYIDKPHELSSIGLTLVSMDIQPAENKSLVSGYLKSTTASRNLVGDLGVLQFTNAQLTTSHVVLRSGIQDVRYEKFTFHDITELWIRLDGDRPDRKDFITLVSDVTMKSHLETLNNEGLEFDLALPTKFDIQGRMNAQLHAGTEQFLQFLVPGGSGLRVDYAGLTYVDGVVQPGGRLVGKLVVPFEMHDVYGPAVPAVYAGDHPATNEMDALASAKSTITSALIGAVNGGLVQFGETVQQNGLLILPDADLNCKTGARTFPSKSMIGWAKGFSWSPRTWCRCVTERSPDAYSARRLSSYRLHGYGGPG